MPSPTTIRFTPLIRGASTSQAFNIEALIRRQRDGLLVIPDFQRDSSQWKREKQSLFIESILNGITTPPLMVYPEDVPDPDGGVYEIHKVIDGQQRLTTIGDFLNNQFPLARATDVSYAQNVAGFGGRHFRELPLEVQNLIRDYQLNLVVLPKGLQPNLRLTIFRRINEGGIPLSPHDLRLAEFAESLRVTFVRLAGIFDTERQGSERMLLSARERALDYPWTDNKQAGWYTWWEGSDSAKGQAASEVFLFYVLARDRAALDALVHDHHRPCGLDFDDTVESALDLYCAQAKAEEDRENPATPMLANLTTLKTWFNDFETWFKEIKTSKVPKVPLNSARKVALFIAAAAEKWQTPDELSAEQWDNVDLFLSRGPNDIKEHFGVNYTTPRGKWRTQRIQMDDVFGIVDLIAG